MTKTILVISSDDVSEDLLKKIREDLTEAVKTGRVPILVVGSDDKVYSVEIEVGNSHHHHAHDYGDVHVHHPLGVHTNE